MSHNNHLVASWFFCFLVAMVFVMITNDLAFAGAYNVKSFIQCRVEGGNVPVMATTMDFVSQKNIITLTVTKEYWDRNKKSTSKQVEILSIDYQRLWNFVETEKVWELNDTVCEAIDMPLFTFHLEKETKEKTIKAMNIENIADKRYYSFFSLFQEIENKYLNSTN